MDPSTLLNRPKTFNITPKITKINNLAIVSGQARKSSSKLVKVFEKGTYQKKTQLSVLNRYKKRLESIQKQNDRSFGRKRKVKLKLPDIKKYVGNFFTPGSANDPLKAIGALAAFTALQKGSKGDWGGALGSGLVAVGLLGGGALALKGAGAMFRGRNAPTAPSKLTSSGGVSEPWWSKNTKSLSRSNQSYAKFIQGNANIGDRARLVRRGMISPAGMFSRGGPEEVAKQAKIGKAFGRFGKAIIPGAGAALGAIDATMRAQEGDVTGAAIAGTSATLDAFAAASAATGIGLPVAGLLSIASFGLDVVNLVRDLSGASEKEAQRNKANQPDRLKKQTQQQKALVDKKKEEKGKLTFSKTLNSYDKAVTKFEEFSKGFDFRESVQQTREQAQNVERLLGDQDIIGEPGYEFTNYTAQYLTGDPSSPAYDEAHGTSSNYHDHIAFNDRDMAIRAYQYLESKGLDVTEFQGFDAVGGHAVGSYHYRGLAFDVPGYQWGATGPIDQRHYNGSRMVRKYLNEFFDSEKRNNPNLKPKTNTGTQQRTRPSQTPTLPSPLFQRPQTPGLSIGQGGFRVNGTSAANLSQARPRRMPDVSQNLPYQEGYSQAQPTIVPYPVVRQQQAAASASSAPMMFPGPSEQQLLNSFYKKVLLNTVQ